MPSATAKLGNLELSEVAVAVGSRSFERGRAYVRRGQVLEVAWEPDGVALTGSVVGNGALYTTTAIFAESSEGTLEFEDGDCSCPIGHNCKHVAAVVIAAVHGRAQVPRSRPVGDAAARAQPPAWEPPLRALIEAPTAHGVGSPLAIELSLHASGLAGTGALRLTARLMRPGARGGWINGSLTWSGFDTWYVHSGEHRPDHVALVRELHAAQRARQGRGSYYYGADKTLDLSDCGPQLWSLLDEAARIGLPLIHAGRGMGELPPYRLGEVASTSRALPTSTRRRVRCCASTGTRPMASSPSCSSAPTATGSSAQTRAEAPISRVGAFGSCG